MADIATVVQNQVVISSDDIAVEKDVAHSFALAEKSEATRRAYRSDFKIFCEWCSNRGVEPLPATSEMVAIFLAYEASRGIRPSTISRRAAAIRYAHVLSRHVAPTTDEVVKATVRGIRRTIGGAPIQKLPATSDYIRQMSELCSNDIFGKRDKALLLLGFAGAFRRSELVALTMSDLTETADGLRVKIRSSKTDQEGMGQEIAIPRGTKLKPVEALRDWLSAANIKDGPVFRRIFKGGHVGSEALSDETVANIVKRYAAKAGYKEADFAGHSLRSGFLTSGAEAGASIFKLMEVSRHVSVDTLKGYVRRAELFKDHAGERFL